MTHGVRMRYLFANSLFPVVRRLYRQNTDAAALHHFEGVSSVWTYYLQSGGGGGLGFDLPDVGYITRSSPPHASLHGLCTGWPLFIYG